MTKAIQTLISALIVYFSFIDVIPFFYWFTTVLYFISGCALIFAAYSLHNNSSLYTLVDIEKQFILWQKYKILNFVKLVALTIVLIYTNNPQLLPFVFSILYFYYELNSAYKRYFR